MKDYAFEFINGPSGKLIEADVLLGIMKYILMKANMFEEADTWRWQFYTQCCFVYHFSDPERKAVHMHFEMLLEAMK